MGGYATAVGRSVGTGQGAEARRFPKGRSNAALKGPLFHVTRRAVKYSTGQEVLHRSVRASRSGFAPVFLFPLLWTLRRRGGRSSGRVGRFRGTGSRGFPGWAR